MKNRGTRTFPYLIAIALWVVVPGSGFSASGNDAPARAAAEVDELPVPPASFTRITPSSAHMVANLDGPIQPRDLEGLVMALLEEFDVPGAAVGLIREGKIIHMAGFGVADRKSGTAVTPRKTTSTWTNPSKNYFVDGNFLKAVSITRRLHCAHS